MQSDVAFTYDGADAKDPWRQLQVLEVRGRETISALYRFELDLARYQELPDIHVADLIGQTATLCIATRTKLGWRFIHGMIASAEELSDVTYGTRFHVVLEPLLLKSTMNKRCRIYLDKTIAQIVDLVLTHPDWGNGLKQSEPSATQKDDGTLEEDQYKCPVATLCWRVVDRSRIDDRDAKPYCVQYLESDFNFVSRLLEEEGISYHFEHTSRECILVLCDSDSGRQTLGPAHVLGPRLLGHTIESFRAGQRVRPRSVSIKDFNWRNPRLDMVAISSAGVTDFQIEQYPGGVEHSQQAQKALADRREQRFNTERRFANAQTRCRLLGAGTLFQVDHDVEKFSGWYLVTAIRHLITSHDNSLPNTEVSDPYGGSVECIRCGASGEWSDSNFRPALSSRRPRILGSQTAVVTADPQATGQEIRLGGPADIGCVRVRFHWDTDAQRLAREASSCWIRVSQLAAGLTQGALWHPHVGDEVIVEFLDGDPERPIITGRVYNGLNKPFDNPTNHPTLSGIKSFSIPFNGSFSKVSFENASGQEEVALVAARDFTTVVHHNASRQVGVNDSTVVSGSQTVCVKGDRCITANRVMCNAETTLTLKAGDTVDIRGETTVVDASKRIELYAKEFVRIFAPEVDMTANNLIAKGTWIDVQGETKIRVGAPIVEVNGTNITIQGGTIHIKGGQINLNCD